MPPPDFGVCPACDKPRKSGQFFVPEYEGLKGIHTKCALKLGMAQPGMEGGPEYFDPATGELLPVAPMGCPGFPGQEDGPADPDAEPPAAPPPPPDDPEPTKAAVKSGCLVRPPAGCTCVAGTRANGENISIKFAPGKPQWMDEEAALLVVRHGGLIEDRK